MEKAAETGNKFPPHLRIGYAFNAKKGRCGSSNNLMNPLFSQSNLIKPWTLSQVHRKANNINIV